MEKCKTIFATGIDIHGRKIGFECIEGSFHCPKRELSSITIPEGISLVRCQMNQLTELIIPEGVVWVDCRENKITHIDLPDSVMSLRADKEVAGLEKYIGTDVDIELY